MKKNHSEIFIKKSFSFVKAGGSKAIVSFAFLTLLIAGCTKTEEKIITGNKPPPDHTIPAGLKVNFINKSYISLLGREPESAEYSAAEDLLAFDNFSETSRKQLIDDIISKPDFYIREFELANDELLNGLDTFEINDIYNTFQYLLTLPDYEAVWPQLTIEINRLSDLKSAPTNLQNQSITIRQMHRICADNYFYDQINMGSLNFVIATFQHFLLRNPTAYESAEGVKIVDGFNGILFLEIGDNKSEFLQLFFNSSDYYEGQVKLLFSRFLFRSPSSEEAAAYASAYKTSGNYKALVSNILSTDEYAGLQ